jgi:hypothetical protein
MKLLHVSDSSSVNHQEFFTVHTAMLYVIPVCGQFASRIRRELQFHPDLLFWDETLHVSDSSSVHHQEFFTVYTAMLYTSYQFADSLQAGSGWNCSCVLILLANWYDV